MSLLDAIQEPSPWLPVGVVGAEERKFSQLGQIRARAIIRLILRPPGTQLVSGGCHLGGIDIWAEEEYAGIRKETPTVPRPEPIIHLPREHKWSTGYKPRDLLIARDSRTVHCLVVDRYIESYTGQRFVDQAGQPLCYHCERWGTGDVPRHVKSGGCWTAYRARQLGKEAVWHVVPQ